MNQVTKFVIRFIILTIVAVLLCTTTAGCASEEEKKYKALPERFVEVDESLICQDYKLDFKMFHEDGTTKSEDNTEIYMVDRVSRRVYIYISNNGAYDSGFALIPCLDKNGDHMRYDGELPN